MPDIVYLNFDLEIEKVDGGYRSHVLGSPAGESRSPLGPLDRVEAGGNPEAVGGALFDAVFHDEVLSSLRRSLDFAGRAEQGLRIRLRLAETPELADLPWELLYDRSRGVFLALSRETPLVRYLDLPEPAESIQPEIRLRILAVIASPSDYPALDTEREWSNLKAALADLEERKIITLDRLEPPTVEALQQQLLRREYHILHFLGHGAFDEAAGDTFLLLQDADGRGDAVSGETFAALVRDQRSLRLALLNACEGALGGDTDPYSGVAQRLVRGGVPAVIAMRSAISDAAAVALARSFYGALAAGAAVDGAMAEARKTLYSGGFTGEWATAVLYMRAADGRLWRPERASRQRNLRLALAGAGLAVALALIALLIWSRTGPLRMDPASTMNIALLDPAGPTEDALAPDAALVRQWMVDELEQLSGSSEGSRTGLWHNGLPRAQKRNPLPRLTAADAESREAEAAQLAAAIGADVVISSRIEDAGGRRQLTQEFYLFSRFAPEAAESIGRYTFGAPVPVPPDLVKADALGRESVARQVSDRTRMLYRLLLALREDVLGRHAEALQVLEGVETELGVRVLSLDELAARSQRVAGLDTLYYFLGREKLFLLRSEEAEEDARRALWVNGTDPRAWIVLGGALSRQSEKLPPAEALVEGGLLDQAEEAFDQAVAAAADDTTANAVARLARGYIRVSRGGRLYELGDASAGQALERAAGELEPLLAILDREGQHRMLAQCRAYLGVARLYQGSIALQQGEEDEARMLFEQSRAHLDACVAKGEQFPEDETLRDSIVAGNCAPARQQAEQALENLGGG